MGNNKYTKADRLRKSYEYKYLSKYGNKFFSNHFVIITVNNNKFRSRLGVTVSKRVGNSGTRSKIKRVIREYFRLKIRNTLRHQDVNVIARKELGGLRTGEIFYSLSVAFDQIKKNRIARNTR